jgi:hypothetical protein
MMVAVTANWCSSSSSIGTPFAASIVTPMTLPLDARLMSALGHQLPRQSQAARQLYPR